ncbi:MAG: cupin domain-containing protein [Peptostreptococcaceae bacterium]|nr:cupin domain-containing protein [Peptostreptococcaceae bacterium]
MVSHEKEKELVAMTIEGALDAGLKVLVGPNEGWNDYVMRKVELEAFGHSPEHAHPWPHINYVLEGKGTILLDGKEIPAEKGTIAYILPGAKHQFSNSGSEPFHLICIVPKEGHII